MRRSVSSASAHLKDGEEADMWSLCFRVFVCKLAALVNSNKIDVHSSEFSCLCLNYV